MYYSYFSYLHQLRENASRKDRAKNIINNWSEQVNLIFGKFDLQTVYILPRTFF